jgi:hypothetical protein
MTKSSTLLIAAGFLGASAVAGVADDRPTIGERQYHQRERIENGVEDGDLTHREARRLRQESRGIAQDRGEALANDGRIDRRERRQLRHEQNHLSNDIYRERHDAQER